MKGVNQAKTAWNLFRSRLKESFRLKYCFWFLTWFLLWNLAMTLLPIHPLIVGLIVWLPTALVVIKLADFR